MDTAPRPLRADIGSHRSCGPMTADQLLNALFSAGIAISGGQR